MGEFYSFLFEGSVDIRVFNPPLLYLTPPLVFDHLGGLLMKSKVKLYLTPPLVIGQVKNKGGVKYTDLH